MSFPSHCGESLKLIACKKLPIRCKILDQSQLRYCVPPFRHPVL
jgi:hypothetical protein